MRYSKNSIFSIATLATLLFISLAFKFKDEVINYFGTSKEITFSKKTYKLSWSSHPNATYYKQEYIPDGDKADTFNDMILIDFIQRDIPVAEVVKAQVTMLNERKKTDNICNYQLINSANGSEYILDFAMSESSGPTLNIVEWNAYRYKAYIDKQGHKGVLLFGISHRSYGSKASSFLKSLKEYRVEHQKALISYPMPNIQIKL